MTKEQVRSLILAAAMAWGARMAAASDVYLIFVNAVQPRGPGTGAGNWYTNPMFFNPGDQAVTARLVGISNGFTPQGSPDATFPPAGFREFPGRWYAVEPAVQLCVYHIDVPSNVLISDRMFFYRETNCGFPACGPGNSGGIPLPVFRSLAPPGTRQVLLDADMGESMSVRSNVSLYNAGENVAHATIEVHIGCDGSVEESQTVTVSPDTIIQANAFATIGVTEACDPFDLERAPYGSRYITVVMDQPGFSLLSVLKNGTFDYTIPIGISAGVVGP